MANTPKGLRGILEEDPKPRVKNRRKAGQTSVLFIPSTTNSSNPNERLAMDFTGLANLLESYSEDLFDLREVMKLLVEVGVRINIQDAVRNMWSEELRARIQMVQEQNNIYLLDVTPTVGPRQLPMKRMVANGQCSLEVASMFGVQFSGDDIERMQIDSSKMEELEEFGLVDADFQYSPEIPESSRISEVVKKVRRITASLHRLPKKG